MSRVKSVLGLLPPVVMILAAGWVWLQAGHGEFRSMMGFPLVFAGVLSACAIVALFVGERSLRRWSAGLLLVAALLAWGGAWSHQSYFTREQETLDRQGREQFGGRSIEPIPYIKAINLAAQEPLLALDQPQTLLNVWATWCSPCVQEMPMLEQFWREHRQRGVDVIGLTRLTGRDELEREAELAEIESFLMQHEVSYPILVVDDEVYRRFNVRRLPTSLWLENGTVQDYRVTIEGTETLLAAISARLTPS